MNIDVSIPEAFEYLFAPDRYIVAYGGRGSGKSVNIGRALLIKAMQNRIRVLCARELQTSIRESVHKLLQEQIDDMGIGDFFEVQQTLIRGKNGSEFLFKGLRHNIAEIKSTHGINIAWVEEAQMVSKASWEVLIPTIRESGSQIWVSFNPELETDETYQRFVVNPPANGIVRKVNWSDNPFFPAVLKEEMEQLRERDPDAYLTVWEGHCRQTLDGAIYANEIRAATEEGRISRVPYERAQPVHTFWDLGRADMTAIWFAQIVGFEFRCIDYYQSRGYALDHYLRVLQDRGYVYGTDWLPHDAQNKQLVHPLSVEDQMRAAGRKVRITPKLNVADGINAARSVFPKTWFDQEKCSDGLQCLRHYRYDVDEHTGGFSKQPLHDIYSHGADAFRYLAVALREDTKPKATPAIPRPSFVGAGGTGWMR